MIYRTKGHASIDGIPHIYWEYDVRYVLDSGADYEIEGNFYRRVGDGEELSIKYSDDDVDVTDDLKSVYVKDVTGGYVSVHDHILAMAEYDENHGRGYWV